MELEDIFWNYLPILIAGAEIVISLRLTIRKNSYFDSIATFLIFALNGLSIYILIAIAMGRWPTYIPHLAILISTILITIQVIRRRINKIKTFGNNGEHL